ncbi:MAG: hypothetical protein K5985_10140 [Lachnospiraceae bacterium]|nr:hypothetical protein [Lachnospiraceae bacterium]
MSVSAIIKDGQIENQGESRAVKKTIDQQTAEEVNSVDKEQFLQLLVAQMQYQDPLEPTNNTEYVSQLATFSELEQMQNMAKSTDLARATSLVGKMVTINKTDATTGVTTEFTGTVDKVVQKSGGRSVYVSVGDELYDLDDIQQVWDDEYASAYTLAETWAKTYAQLPKLEAINANNAGSYVDAIKTLRDSYNAMSNYEKSFLSPEMAQGLNSYINRLAELGFSLDEKETGTGTGGGSSTPSTGNESTTPATGGENTTPVTGGENTTPATEG